MIASQCFRSLKNIGRIKTFLTQKHIQILISSTVLSRMDYCNCLYANVNHNITYKLQKILNSAARLTKGLTRRQSARNSLIDLHWLPIESRVAFKYLLFTYKIIKGFISPGTLQIDYKIYSLRPADHLKLKINFPSTQYGKRTFQFVASRLWNILPLELRSCDDLISFKKDLKTFLFDKDTLLRRALTN